MPITRGDTVYQDSPPQFLTEAYSSSPQRVTLRNYVPQGALSYRVRCPLFRGVADQYGNIDVAALCFLPGNVGVAVFDIFGEAAISGTRPSVPAGTLYEPTCNVVEIPNVTEGSDWAVFYWVLAGNTLPGSRLTLQLLSHRMPSGGGGAIGILDADQIKQVRDDIAARL